MESTPVPLNAIPEQPVSKAIAEDHPLPSEANLMNHSDEKVADHQRARRSKAYADLLLKGKSIGC